MTKVLIEAKIEFFFTFKLWNNHVYDREFSGTKLLYYLEPKISPNNNVFASFSVINERRVNYTKSLDILSVGCVK